MPERITISNTSPLLYLHIVGQLGLLSQLYGHVLIPPAVQAELKAGAQRGVNVPPVEALPWMRITPLASETLVPLATDLGRGEAEVISLGLERPNSRLILDDTLARRIAQLNRLQITGTMGVILKAKQRELLDTVKPVVLALRNAGLWLSDSLVAQVLRQAGEL
jgi:predicted nucleic acid-binding protein